MRCILQYPCPEPDNKSVQQIVDEIKAIVDSEINEQWKLEQMI